jgi:hypothetical protein
MSMIYEVTYKNSATSRKVHTRIVCNQPTQQDDEVILSVRCIGEYAGDWCQI